MSLTQIVRRYSQDIVTDRTLETISAYGRGEMDELDQEIAGTGDGRDGVVGEAIDVIACMLDIIFQHSPNVTDVELDHIMEAKCAKWAAKHRD